jgi:Rap1a immunity proteins
MWTHVLCLAFIQGLVYAGGKNYFWPQNGVTNRQAMAVVVKYIEARPERMHEHFGLLAVEALTAAWPCKR